MHVYRGSQGDNTGKQEREMKQTKRMLVKPKSSNSECSSRVNKESSQKSHTKPLHVPCIQSQEKKWQSNFWLTST